MSHHINVLDYYANFDRSISGYNFLRYSEGAWRLLNSPLSYQNRLRLSDYRRIHRWSGFTLLREDNEPGSSTI